MGSASPRLTLFVTDARCSALFQRSPTGRHTSRASSVGQWVRAARGWIDDVQIEGATVAQPRDGTVLGQPRAGRCACRAQDVPVHPRDEARLVVVESTLIGHAAQRIMTFAHVPIVLPPPGAMIH